MKSRPAIHGGPKTEALLPLDIHGLPADVDEIVELAVKYGLTVVEDACQRMGQSTGP